MVDVLLGGVLQHPHHHHPVVVPSSMGAENIIYLPRRGRQHVDVGGQHPQRERRRPLRVNAFEMRPRGADGAADMFPGRRLAATREDAGGRAPAFNKALP